MKKVNRNNNAITIRWLQNPERLAVGQRVKLIKGGPSDVVKAKGDTDIYGTIQAMKKSFKPQGVILVLWDNFPYPRMAFPDEIARIKI